MIISDEDKYAIYSTYLGEVSHIFQDLTVTDMVYKVLEITEKRIEEMNQWRAFLEKDLGAADE